MAPAVFPDNTVLINFGTVGRLDLLKGWLRGRGRWTEAVKAEATKSADFHPGLKGLVEAGWLGDPIELNDDLWSAINLLRTNVFGGSDDRPTQHLGESQTCYLLKHDPGWAGARWVSDDRDSVEWAKRNFILTSTTVDVVRNIIGDGDLTAQHGYDLLDSMVAAGRRNIRLPDRPGDLLR